MNERIEYIISVTKGKPEFLGKEKIAVYLSKPSMDRIKEMSAEKNIPIYKEIIALMNDGLRYRRMK